MLYTQRAVVSAKKRLCLVFDLERQLTGRRQDQHTDLTLCRQCREACKRFDSWDQEADCLARTGFGLRKAVAAGKAWSESRGLKTGNESVNAAQKKSIMQRPRVLQY